jgi:lipopolysaccharide transport system ATP-binding protein
MALALKIEGLSKYYKLGAINNGTLWKDMQSYFARLRGAEDPNLEIGQEGVYDREGFWALSDINLEIEQGDRVGIMGKNGAGKSTLLKILSRITIPTKGCFHVKGRITSLLEVGTGFHNELTGRENIYMNGSILGMKRGEITRRLDEIIEFSEIGPHIDTPVKRYSSGMYIRLGFAIAAHMECEIIVADEVLAVGDLNFQQKAIGKMGELSASSGKTIIFVSHNVVAVDSLCNKGVVLDHGKIILDQCPAGDAVKKYKEVIGIA